MGKRKGKGKGKSGHDESDGVTASLLWLFDEDAEPAQLGARGRKESGMATPQHLQRFAGAPTHPGAPSRTSRHLPLAPSW